MSTLKATNLKNESSATNNLTLDASGNVTASGDVTVTGDLSVGGAVSLNPTIGSNSHTAGFESSTSTSYVDLTTAQSVTLTTGTKALVHFSMTAYANVGQQLWTSVAVSGASTISASDNWSIYYRPAASGYAIRTGVTHLFTGLTAGSNTFTLKFKVDAGSTGNWNNRELIVIDMGS